jgi:hypothetical protein
LMVKIDQFNYVIRKKTVTRNDLYETSTR